MLTVSYSNRSESRAKVIGDVRKEVTQYISIISSYLLNAYTYPSSMFIIFMSLSKPVDREIIAIT